jgi:hypothetical protein
MNNTINERNEDRFPKKLRRRFAEQLGAMRISAKFRIMAG